MGTIHISAYRVELFVIFLVFGLSLPALSGLLIFPFSLIPNSLWQIYLIILSFFFLTLAVFFYRNKRFKKYWQIAIAFFIASFALNLQAISGWLGFETTTMNGIVLAMLSSTALVVTSIIVLTRFSGGSMYSVFLSKGKIRLGVLVGLAGFLVFVALSIPGANYLFEGQNLTISKLVSWMPWILPIVLANGLREELLYRWSLLEKIRGFAGKRSIHPFASADFFPQPLGSWNWHNTVHTIHFSSCCRYVSSRFGVRLCYAENRQHNRTNSIARRNRHTHLHWNFLKSLIEIQM